MKITVLVLFLGVLSVQVEGICKTENVTSFEQAVLDRHNELRRLHQDTADLCYGQSGEDISFSAQVWADKLAIDKAMEHSMSSEYYDSSNPYGENLGSASTSGPIAPENVAYERITQKWYNEIDFWNFTSSTATGVEETRHFTQVVWAGTQQLNCGYAPYVKTVGVKVFGCYYVVCQYYPAGNLVTVFSDNVELLEVTSSESAADSDTESAADSDTESAADSDTDSAADSDTDSDTDSAADSDTGEDESVTTTCDKPTISNGALAPDSATVDLGEGYTVSCDAGYAMEGAETMTCATNGTLSTAPTCTVITCGKPTITDGTAILWECDNCGEMYTIICDDGFAMTGDANMICGIDGEFDQTPTCEVVTCDKPSIADGDVTSDSDTVDYGETYTVMCNEGFTMNGTATLTCGGEGLFDNSPICSVTTCDKPTISDGDVSPTGPTIAYGDSYTASCDVGFAMAGTDTMECGSDGEVGESPTCAVITCDKPTISNGTASPDSAAVDFGESYSISCDDTFTITGSDTMTCAGDGNFDQTPVCKATTCEKPSIAHGYVLPSTASVAAGNTYTAQCEDGYKVAGTAVMTCGADGALTSQPTCQVEDNNTDGDYDYDDDETDASGEQQNSPCSYSLLFVTTFAILNLLLS